MLFPLPEYSAFVWISGFTEKPKDLDTLVRAIQDKYPDVSVQFVDMNKVPGSRYLFLATLNALKSFSSKPVSKSLSMEILLYIGANRQISEAIRLVGISPNSEKVSAVVVGRTKEETSGAAELLSKIVGQEGSDKLVDTWSSDRVRNVRAIFEIGSKELKATLRSDETRTQAIERLAIERSALLTIRK
ncbi:MAG TPA: KEOPS complex subunit Cgi121 [Candidatus Acidoferrum sp.]|nr:KEOPS complex subunit Cgi121 [Candidatus Acidoferrum sp.]